MSRLTEREAYWFGEEFWISAKEPDDEEIDEVYMKLKHYEDLEEQGLLLKLPCKVGDVVYYFSHRPFNLSILPNTIYEADVVRIVTTHLGISIVIQIRNEHGCTEVSQVSSFGKSVFFTKEEAEAKLKELENE